MSVREAQQRIDSQEFSEWMAYAQLEPFGERRADLRSALVAWTVASAMCGTKTRKFELDDFLLNFDGTAEPRRRQTVTEMTAMLRARYRTIEGAA